MTSRLFKTFSPVLLLLLDFLVVIIDGARNFSSGHIAKCEYDVLRLGSAVADIFNAPIGQHNWHERSHQDDIVSLLGFAPWVANGVLGSQGLTLNGTNAKQLHSSAGWISRSIEHSPYAILNHKWVYMFGDSTTRQIWASYAAPFQGNNFARNAKEWTRRYCNKQSHRVNHKKDGHFDHEGWRGPCGVNEVTCYISGYGDEGLLTWDWKHFPYEDYDNFVWGENGIFHVNPKERRPDILTIQFGMHSCWHANPNGHYSKHLNSTNVALIEQHLYDIEKLVSAVRRAVDRHNNNDTLVIFMTSGSSYHHPEIDDCILRFNRVASDVAHRFGFAVLERGEIERRLMFKSIQHASPPMKADMHLAQPAQSVISTCLLQLLNCLNTTEGVSGHEIWGIHHVTKGAPAASIQHNPQDVR